MQATGALAELGLGVRDRLRQRFGPFALGHVPSRLGEPLDHLLGDSAGTELADRVAHQIPECAVVELIE